MIMSLMAYFSGKIITYNYKLFFIMFYAYGFTAVPFKFHNIKTL